MMALNVRRELNGQTAEKPRYNYEVGCRKGPGIMFSTTVESLPQTCPNSKSAFEERSEVRGELVRQG